MSARDDHYMIERRASGRDFSHSRDPERPPMRYVYIPKPRGGRALGAFRSPRAAVLLIEQADPFGASR